MTLSPQDQATLLLTCSLGKTSTPEEKPLTNAEWSRFATWMRGADLAPADFLQEDATTLFGNWSDRTIKATRIQALLNRGAALGLALEKWQRAGLWVLTRSSPHYPKRLRQKLKGKSPPVLFGSGPQKLLNQGGVAIVGSRNANEDDLCATEHLGRFCAANEALVISGGARGVDQTSIISALQAGGQAVGVLSSALMRAASSSAFRPFLMSGQLTLISPFYPEAGFHAGNAMARNKYIYCLADIAVVIASKLNQGGTWAGAQENINQKWVPLWVHPTQAEGTGNEVLVSQGAKFLPREMEQLRELIRPNRIQTPETQEIDLFSAPGIGAAQSDHEGASEVQIAMDASGTDGLSIPDHTQDSASDYTDYYATFKSDLRTLIRNHEINSTEMYTAEISEKLGLHRNQVNAWLKLAAGEKIVKKHMGPVRYSFLQAI